MTLAAIAMELEARKLPGEAEVILAAGLPLTSFGRDKKAFRQYLLRNSKPIDFRYEGRPYRITIKDVQLFPQGYSAVIWQPDLLEQPSVIVADIGGWTVDLMEVDNQVPNAATCRSLELGVIRCLNEISEQLRRTLGLSLTNAQIESVLRGTPSSLSREVRELIQKEAERYTARLLSAIQECGMDYRAMPMVVLGGGAGFVRAHYQPGADGPPGERHRHPGAAGGQRSAPVGPVHGHPGGRAGKEPPAGHAPAAEALRQERSPAGPRPPGGGHNDSKKQSDWRTPRMNIYADIIHQPRPESSHPRMRREERAKLFAPFAALSGHDQAVHDREKVLVLRVLMTDYALEELDRKLQALQKGDAVTVTWFLPLQRAENEVLGQYFTAADTFERLDPYERLLYLKGQVIPMDDLADLRREAPHELQ